MTEVRGVLRWAKTELRSQPSAKLELCITRAEAEKKTEAAWSSQMAELSDLGTPLCRAHQVKPDVKGPPGCNFVTSDDPPLPPNPPPNPLMSG